MEKDLWKKLDKVILFVPLAIIIALCIVFLVYPENSSQILNLIRIFLGNDFGLYYIILGVGAVAVSIYIAFSRYGKIKLGNIEKPIYGDFKWGAMIFTSTMAADIHCASGCFMEMTLTLRRWVECRNGHQHIACFTGDRSRGAFTLYLL